MMKKYRIMLAITSLIVLVNFTSPASAFFEDYKGKVIDADTKEPIEGAVVAAIWTREVKHFNVTDEIFKKTRETLTDKNGEFSIKPYHHYSLRPLSKLWLRWVIFKPGYGSFSPGRYPRHPKVKPKGISPNGLTSKIFSPYTVVELPKLKTRRERRKYLIDPPWTPVPVEKIPLLIGAINIENTEIGLRAYDIEGLKVLQKEEKEEERRDKKEAKEYKKELRRLRRNRRYIRVTIVSPQDGATINTDSLEVVVNFGPKKNRMIVIRNLTLELNGEKPISYKYKKTLVRRYPKPVTEGTHTFKLEIKDLPPGEHTLQVFSSPRSMPRSYPETPSPMVTFIKEDIAR